MHRFRSWPFFALALSACSDPTQLTASDLDKLCSAARTAGAKEDPKPSAADVMIGDLLKKAPSRGMLKMLETDLITNPDKGAVITEWRERSGLGDYDCASLEAIYPGATSHPLDD